MVELTVYVDDWYTDEEGDLEGRIAKARARIKEISSLIGARGFRDVVEREPYVPTTCQYVEYIQVSGVFEVDDPKSAKRILSEHGLKL